MSILNIPNLRVRPSLNDFDIICRICLSKEDDKNKLQPISAYIDKWNPDKVLNLCDRIRFCSDINVEDNLDILPYKICDKCVNLLFIAHYFKKLSANSDKILRKIIEHSERLAAIKIELDAPEKESDYSLFDENDAFKTTAEMNETQDRKFSCDVSQNITEKIIYEVKEFKDGNEHDKNVDLEQGRDKKIQKNEKEDLVSVLNENEEINEVELENDQVPKDNEDETTGYYECLLCNNLSFSRKSDLTRHMYVHHQPGKYKCYGCDSVFDKYSERTEHEKYSCPNMPSGSKYECSKCKEKCDNRLRFDSHTKFGCTYKLIRPETKTIELEPFFKCPHCNLITKCKYNLKNHILNCHTEEKPYICEMCGKGYGTVSSLKSHLKQSHAKEKNYKCPYCPYAARQPSSLNRHIRRHTLEYRYSCEICGASFLQNTGYHEHMRRRHKEKEFQCDICKKMFSLKNAMKEHVSSVHLGLKRHQCETCGAAFSKKRSLRAHLLRVHNITMKPNPLYHYEKVVCVVPA